MALTKDEIKEFKKEEKEAEDCFSFTFIADQISDAGDKEWAKNLYKKAEEKEPDFNDLRGLANSVFENLDDEEWSRTLYKKAEEKAESYDDFKDLAESLCEILGDKEWARNLYKKTGKQAQSFRDFLDLAESLCEILDDKELARNFYKKAEEKAVGDERYHLVQSKNDYLGDVEGDE
jgi:hypothetical protein